MSNVKLRALDTTSLRLQTHSYWTRE